MPSIFISYRQVDSQHATFAIADRLRWAFGIDEVFFDRGSIRAGNEWPALLRGALDEARVLLVMIGRSWLTAADEWARRRIDDASDWVRREVCTGLEGRRLGRKQVVPVLLTGAQRLRVEGLGTELQELAEIQPVSLTDDNWEDGIDDLIGLLSEATGIPRNEADERNPNGSPSRPFKRESNQVPMSDPEVRAALELLPRWQLRRGPHPWGVGGQAHEITKSYDFESFAEAVGFMQWSAKRIDGWRPPHHPRWENQWKVVTVWFSTWDVDCRVTKLDIEAARKLDALYRSWITTGREKKAK